MSLLEYASNIYPNALMSWQKTILEQCEYDDLVRVNVLSGTMGKLLMQLLKEYEKKYKDFSTSLPLKDDLIEPVQLSIFDYLQ